MPSLTLNKDGNPFPQQMFNQSNVSFNTKASFFATSKAGAFRLSKPHRSAQTGLIVRKLIKSNGPENEHLMQQSLAANY